jgi:alanine-glyoxylate transaminase/serine-glyoxylate transaminase/serine-pyruvate transaminase
MEDVEATNFSKVFGELLPPDRLMMTPGPSTLDPRVARALMATLVGHLDPWFTQLMLDEVQVMLRAVFRTSNRVTFPISASGSGGIEAAMVNLLEEGDEALICTNGAFSERMAEMAERTGARVTRVVAPPGRVVDPEDLRRAGQGRPIKLIGAVHGESSTSAASPLEAYREVADELGALLVVDTVSTLAGMPVDVEDMGLDVCFSGSQKALGAPPGLAPITLNERAERAIRARRRPVPSWYFDLTAPMQYWGRERTYHHTPPIPLIYGLREALRLVLEEGLEARWQRHRDNQRALVAGIEALGLRLLVENPEERMTTVTAICVPTGVDERRVRMQLLDEFNIEIAGGFGPLRGRIWRVGTMGYTAQRRYVLMFLAAFEKVLVDQGVRVPTGAGVAAAIASYGEVPKSAGMRYR